MSATRGITKKQIWEVLIPIILQVANTTGLIFSYLRPQVSFPGAILVLVPVFTLYFMTFHSNKLRYYIFSWALSLLIAPQIAGRVITFQTTGFLMMWAGIEGFYVVLVLLFVFQFFVWCGVKLIRFIFRKCSKS